MQKASISELKARLSSFLELVRHGEEVLVTDRGHPIARLAPIAQSDREEGRRELLLRSGKLRAPAAGLPGDFWQRPRPVDREGRSVAALLEERGEGL